MPEGSLILTDFIGGTTSNVAARLSADYPVAVISGLNASLLLEALDKREHGRLTTCVAELVDAGRSSCLAVQQGFDVSTIQVGGLGGGPNRKAVFQNITLDEKDVGILSDLKNRGIQVFFQTIPEDKPQSLDDILKKF